MNTLPDSSIQASRSTQERALISSDARHMVRIGKLIGTHEAHGKLKIASEEETLTSTFGGGIEKLPPYEQRLSKEEWKFILGRCLEKEKNEKAKRKIKEQIQNSWPPVRQKNDIIPQETFRYRLPESMKITPKHYKEITYILHNVNKDLSDRIKASIKLSQEEKDVFLQRYGAYIQFLHGRVFIDIKWTFDNRVTSLPTDEFLCNNGYSLPFVGQGSMHGAEWMTIEIKLLPPDASAKLIYNALVKHLGNKATIREIWEVYIERDHIKTKAREALCLLELDFEKPLNITRKEQSDHDRWLDNLYPFLRIGRKTCELNFIGKNNWCFRCIDKNVKKHLSDQCPALLCIKCGTKGHYAKNCTK